MVWDIALSQDFDAWFGDLEDPEQEAIVLAVEVLKDAGDNLDAAPFVHHRHGSRQRYARELHVNGNGLDVPFTYDPKGSTILLLAEGERP